LTGLFDRGFEELHLLRQRHLGEACLGVEKKRARSAGMCGSVANA